MHTLLVVTLGLAAFSLVLTLVTQASVLIVRRREKESSAFPPISVLKPLKGAEPGLYENLASIAQQRYPEFEILFGCEDPEDPALAVARRVQRDFPHVPIQVLAGAAAIGRNPKVNNVRMLSARARHDCVLISDSNVRAEPDYLAAMAAELEDPRVGLVSSVLVGRGERSFGARLDNLHMNSSIVRGVCGAAVVARHPCVIGKSMLFRLSELGRLGGFALVDDVLAEDYVLGRRYSEAGFRVALSSYPIDAMTVERSLRDFCARHVRWSQMRRRLLPVLYWFEPLETPIPWLVISLALMPFLAPAASWPVLVSALGVGLVLRLFSDGLVVQKLRGTPLSPADYATILVKDLVFIGIWAVGGVKRSVSWRGNKLRIGAGSRLVPIEVSPRPSAALEGA